MNREKLKEKVIADLRHAEYCLGVCRNAKHTPYQEELSEYYGIRLKPERETGYDEVEYSIIASDCLILLEKLYQEEQSEYYENYLKLADLEEAKCLPMVREAQIMLEILSQEELAEYYGINFNLEKETSYDEVKYLPIERDCRMMVRSARRKR